jgi:hypothetical protein
MLPTNGGGASSLLTEAFHSPCRLLKRGMGITVGCHEACMNITGIQSHWLFDMALQVGIILHASAEYSHRSSVNEPRWVRPIVSCQYCIITEIRGRFMHDLSNRSSLFAFAITVIQEIK